MVTQRVNQVGTATSGAVRAGGGQPLSVEELIRHLESLRLEMRARHTEYSQVLERVRPGHRKSVANLIDYLTLRQYDLREVQDSLAVLGLSSLGRTEEHVITTLERVLDNLHALAGSREFPRTESAVSFWEGRAALEANATALLGSLRRGRVTRIMVTMPTEAAGDPALVRRLMEEGMDCARINCAHDGPEQWELMVRHIRQTAIDLGRTCPILVDLPGPKLRTGPIEAGPKVVRLRPRRDAWGRATVPARAVLVAQGAADTPAVAARGGPVRIPVPVTWLERVGAGDTVELRDTRDASRTLRVTMVDGTGAWVEISDTTYLATGTVLTTPRAGATAVGALPAVEQAVVLRRGDVLTMTADLSPAPSSESESLDTEARGGSDAPNTRCPRIGCTVPEVLASLRVGERVFFDDGKIGGVVVAEGSTSVDVRITIARPDGSKLRAEKGINVPDSDVRLPAVGPDDEGLLPFVVANADIVGLSFTQGHADVARLQDRLNELGGGDLGIVLKIETSRGFAALPEILIGALASERVGVMVARGDLAVECGFERLAEVQEEILWLCDAAHVPTIWATQVLDQMAKTGQPSRAEVSDAAMAGRAECVMLNKGPYIDEAVAALDDILQRMGSHQFKKMNLLRRLSSWPLSSTPPHRDDLADHA